MIILLKLTLDSQKCPFLPAMEIEKPLKQKTINQIKPGVHELQKRQVAH